MDVGRTLSLGAELIRRTFSPGDTPRAPCYSRNQEPQRPETAGEGSQGATGTAAATTGGAVTTGAAPLSRRVRQQMSLMERLQRIGLQGIIGADGQPVSAARSRPGAGVGAAGAGAISRGQLGAPGRPGSAALKGRLALLGTVQAPRGRARRAVAGRGRAREREGCVGTVGVLAAGRKGGFL